MSEKFFVVTEASELFKEYFEWRQNIRDVNALVKDFMGSHGIETKEYSASNEKFYIVPTENDCVHFVSQLASHEVNAGLRAFKKNSHIGKEWAAELKARGLIVKHRPYTFLYIKNSCGRSSSRLFDIGGTLYMSFSSESNFEAEKWIYEIRGSEYYKAIEDYEAQA